MTSPGEATSGEAWGKAASKYSITIAAPSSVAADQLVDMANNLYSFDESSYVLDLGTGTGVLARDIIHKHPTTKVLATDISGGMVEHVARQRFPNVSTQVLDALDVHTLGREVFSHIFSAFVLQFVLKPDAVLSQIHDALRPHGVVGVGFWHESIDPFEIWQKACRTIDPTYTIGTEWPDPNAWVKPEQVKQALERAKFTDVNVIDTWIPSPVPDVDTYVAFWESGNNPSAWHVIRQWKGDRKKAMDAVKKVLRDEYGAGTGVKLHVILAVGRKVGS